MGNLFLYEISACINKPTTWVKTTDLSIHHIYYSGQFTFKLPATKSNNFILRQRASAVRISRDYANILWESRWLYRGRQPEQLIYVIAVPLCVAQMANIRSRSRSPAWHRQISRSTGHANKRVTHQQFWAHLNYAKPRHTPSPPLALSRCCTMRNDNHGPRINFNCSESSDRAEWN